MNQLTAWILSFIMLYAPPGGRQFSPEAKETVDETKARYESIAFDITEVFKTEKAFFKGPDGKIRSMAVVLSIMKHESDFRRDVDKGKGKYARGDSGNSVCLMQLNVGVYRTTKWNIVADRPAQDTDPKTDTVEGWSASELLADRTKCIRAGVRLLRYSIATCSKILPQKDWLRAYVSGSCASGAEASELRMKSSIRWFIDHKPGFDDSIYETPLASASIKTLTLPADTRVVRAE